MILPCKTVADIMDFVEVVIVNVEAVVTRIVTWDIFFCTMSHQ
jgi:2-keto-4-pentenoate hydratase